MNLNLAFALGGGGSRGALQVGAMRALFEAGIRPSILTGTSIGSMNSVAIGIWGAELDTIDRMEEIWKEVADLQLLDPRFQNLIIRALVGRPDTSSQHKTIDFLNHIGITADLSFEDVLPYHLGLVSADLINNVPVIYGLDPSQKIQEGVLASIALQPWFMPINNHGRYLVDGGVVSNVPIEPAMYMHANEIIALDLTDTEPSKGNALNQYADRLATTVTTRITHLEIALAEAKGIPVHYLSLRAPGTQTWDFANSAALITMGYDQARTQMNQWFEKDPALLTALASG
ncbi:MAG: patatin-like phospholipase family protein [Anaerolineaceae bacterium]